MPGTAICRTLSRRRSPEAIPSECGSLPVGWGSCQRLRRVSQTIIQPCAAKVSTNPRGPTAPHLPARRLVRHRSSDRCLCGGLRRFSGASGRELECLWLCHRKPLHRRASEERKDAVHVRSSAAVDVRELVVSARRVAAVLVLESPSGAENGYLTVLRCSRRIGPTLPMSVAAIFNSYKLAWAG
jgi:hypothetical protein